MRLAQLSGGLPVLNAVRVKSPAPAEGLLVWPPLAVAVVAIGLLVCSLFWLLTDATTMGRLAGEGGIIESATAVLYGVAIAGLLAAARRERWFFVGSAFAVGLMLARELDLHRLASQSALAVNSYKAGGMPFPERLIAGGIVLVLAACLAAYLIANAARFWRGLRDRRAPAWTVAAMFLLMAYSATIDGLRRKAQEFLGIELPLDETKRFLGAFEEGMELLIPLLVLLALVQALWTAGKPG
jgi:hypothetical protein